MKTLHVQNPGKIRKNKKRLEKELNANITIKGKEIQVQSKEDDSVDEFFDEKIIEALDFGFPLKTALLVGNEDFHFEILNIKDYTKRKDLERIRARIIGKKAKTIKTLMELTRCAIKLEENEIGIIGPNECIQNAQQGIESLVRGAKQANVYKFIESHQPSPVVDLGLKKGFKE